uniref:Lipid-binding serum glycoprotein C-terminal domain-containing protein n=1 Tax=Paramoeba aestuarina TaxID=180227 RepID=A0A7S4KHN8_9EUKA|eukprot:CAMPEP_0201523354 /NCGR_PEP_ID=MMETSP0161_2-20130828/19544_1 /ASSEMBLY_ACC=CAM_ASM_000251 /TAXON_ID=180227 /ORGANISM="Neoparamoeba aestuarina, Strain SoJaBio B1-5/56/2" /LENGTH=498 /DNA_ID=CAMNT_0047922453 /DNA_START=37 /DNA_END=1533 /DNA_ORIENTATION=-
MTSPFLKLACVVLLVGLSLAQSPVDTLGLAASPEALTGLLNKIILPIVDDVIFKVGSALPSDCCYKSVGLPGTRLYLEKLDIPQESIISSGSVTTSTQGVFTQADVAFNMTFYLHICEETLGHCTTILRCNGDANVYFTTDLRMLANIYPDENGQPVVAVDSFFFNLNAPEKTGLCNLVDVFLDTLIPLINDAINLVAPIAISEGLTAVLHDIPQTIVLPESAFDLHWAMTNTTGSSNVGSSLMFNLDVLVKDEGDQAGPFMADPSIPNALDILTGDGALGLDFSDAIINNIVYSVFTIKNPTFQTKVDGFDVEISFPASPVFAFTNKTGLDSASLTLTLKVLLKKSILRITAHATVIAFFEVIVLPEGKITLQLNPDDLNVTITSTSPPTTNSTKTAITEGIEDTWASAVPGINNDLMAHAIPLPHIADFNHPYITYGNGYAAVGFDTAEDIHIDVDMIERLVKAVTFPIGTMVQDERSCPNLGAIGAEPTECEDTN